MEEFEYGDQFLGYFTFFLNNDRNLEIQENRVAFDFDYQNSGYLGTWHICNKKLWCIRKVGRSPDFELLFFDLTETNPKDRSIEIFSGYTEVMFQWSENLLLKYYQENGEFSYYDLNTCQWSRIFQRSDLRRIESKLTEFEFREFMRFDVFGGRATVQRQFDSDFNAFFFDKTKKQLVKVPFKTPLKLTEIAWYTVLNNGLLNELNKRKIIIYPTLF
uniref:Uncharacterized protein n=1 Tax=Panagrolaimus sp. PS1159 TaxID=55785 RepID=A0AC35G6E4_9BILA